jgi:hypothetical protein
VAMPRSARSPFTDHGHLPRFKRSLGIARDPGVRQRLPKMHKADPRHKSPKAHLIPSRPNPALEPLGAAPPARPRPSQDHGPTGRLGGRAKAIWRVKR